MALQCWSAHSDDLMVQVPSSALYDPSRMLNASCFTSHQPHHMNKLSPAGACWRCPASIQGHADHTDQQPRSWYSYALCSIACLNVWPMAMPIAATVAVAVAVAIPAAVALPAAVAIPAAFSTEFLRVLLCACLRLCTSWLPWPSAPVASHGLWLAVPCG